MEGDAGIIRSIALQLCSACYHDPHRKNWWVIHMARSVMGHIEATELKLSTLQAMCRTMLRHYGVTTSTNRCTSAIRGLGGAQRLSKSSARRLRP